MRPSRSYRPDATILEGRAVLSRLGLHPAAAPEFPLDVKQSVAAGIPVYVAYSIDKAGVGVETETELTEHVPDSNTWTFYYNIVLPNNQGVERSILVQTETALGDYTNTWTIDEPDGTVVTQRRDDVVAGNLTTYTIDDGLDGGGTDTGIGDRIAHGNTSITTRIYSYPNGVTRGVRSVVVDHGEFNQTETDLTTWSTGLNTVAHSTRTGVRLPPPTN